MNLKKETNMMFSPLLDQIIERTEMAVLNADQVDDFIASGETILFIAGDPNRFPETHDVAVVLPELLKASDGRLKAAVISRDAERAVQKRFHFNKFPALIFNRDGGYLGVIPKVLDWGDYLREITEILARDASEIPGYKLPDGCRDHVESVEKSKIKQA